MYISSKTKLLEGKLTFLDHVPLYQHPLIGQTDQNETMKQIRVRHQLICAFVEQKEPTEIELSFFFSF